MAIRPQSGQMLILTAYGESAKNSAGIMLTRINTDLLEEMAMKAKVAEIAAKLTWLKPCEAVCYMNVR